MKHDIVYTFLATITNPFIAKFLKFLLKMPFISATVEVVELENLKDKNTKKYKRSQLFLKKLSFIVEEFKINGFTKYEVINNLEKDFERYKIKYYGLPKQIYNIWDDLDKN